MALTGFTIKQNDTRPVYVTTLQDNVDTTPVAIDLTNATGVKFKMRTHGSTGIPKVNQPMAFVNRANGQVSYTWTTGDTDTVGTYDVEFEITWNDGGIETVPNDSYKTVNVVDDLDSP